MTDPLTPLLVALAGLAAGVASGLFGVGGGVLMVPAALYLIPGTGFHEAKAASLVVILFSAGVGIWTHARRRSVDLRAGGLLILGGILGTGVSATGVEALEDRTLLLLFAALLALTGVRLTRDAPPREHPLPPRAERALLVGLGALGGILAGAFGIGGGVVMVPGLVFAGVGMHMAVGTSLVAILGNAAVATMTHAVLGYGPELLGIGLPLAVGAVPGTALGSLWAHRLHAARLKALFGAFLVAIGLLMGADALL